MWLKLAGSLLIILAGTSIGWKAAQRFSDRPRQIRQVINCLASLKSYMNYAALPLPEALRLCTGNTEGVIRDIFQNMSFVLEENGWLTPQEAMTQTISSLEEKLALETPELEALRLLSSNLGSVDQTEQEKFLQVVQNQLLQLEEEALQLRERNVKMYRYLGVCGSLMVVIVLL